MKYHITIVLFAALCCVGCGGQYDSVSGKVTYPDGTPVTVGQVAFENDDFLGRADLQPDGSYRMGRFTDGDGIPHGTYRVYLLSTTVFENSPDGGSQIERPQVAMRFTNPETSGLSVTVEGNTVFDFTVERP